MVINYFGKIPFYFWKTIDIKINFYSYSIRLPNEQY